MVRHIGVFTPEGQIELMRIASPRSRHSLAAAFVIMQTAALLAEYALAPADALIPDAEETLTMLPPRPACRIACIACFVPRKTPSRLIAMTRRQSSRLVSVTSAPNEIPAQF